MTLRMSKIHKRPFVNSLLKYRKLMRYKQKEVAKLLQLHDTSQLCRWEKGIALPNTINLLKLSIIYRTFPNELYFSLLVELRHELIKMETILLKE